MKHAVNFVQEVFDFLTAAQCGRRLTKPSLSKIRHISIGVPARGGGEAGGAREPNRYSVKMALN